MEILLTLYSGNMEHTPIQEQVYLDKVYLYYNLMEVIKPSIMLDKFNDKDMDIDSNFKNDAEIMYFFIKPIRHEIYIFNITNLYNFHYS